MDDHTPELLCHKCDNSYPLTSEYWYKDRTKLNGFCTPCKHCRLEKQTEYDKTHREECAIRSRDWRELNGERHSEYSRGWAARHPQKIKRRQARYRAESPEKNKAHTAIHNAVSRGKIPSASSLSCIDCGGQAQEYHHPDYTKPMEVVPLCIKCHKRRHWKNYDGSESRESE